MNYVSPKSVCSPKKRWTLIAVLHDGGEGEHAYAIGMWDEQPALAVRWNGTKEFPLGNPQSRGLPVWTILPEDLHSALLRSLPRDEASKVASLMSINLVEVHLHKHQSGNFTAEERLPGRICDVDIFSSSDESAFCTTTLNAIQHHQNAGAHVLLSGTEILSAPAGAVRYGKTAFKGQA